MNTNGTNPDMSVDDYENMAVQKSNTAKKVAAGAAMLVGGAAVGGGAAYAAANDGNINPEIEDDNLTAEDVVDGASVGETYQESGNSHTETTEHVVYVEKEPEPVEEPVEEETESAVTWDEKTVVYDEEGNVTGSIEAGTVDGKNFVLMDVDGDDHADYLAIDVNGNNRFDDNEIVQYDVSDHVHMGHDTAHTTEIHYKGIEPSDDSNYVAQNDADNSIHNNFEDENDADNSIHNDFEDEKTGESYHDDYAENNPDYNPNADMNGNGNENDYLAENEAYDAEVDSYSADEYLAENEGSDSTEEYMSTADMELQEDPLESSADYTAETETADSYDDMVGGEEFLG